MFLSTPSLYEDQVVPMNDVYAEVKKTRQADQTRRLESLARNEFGDPL